MSEIRFNPNLVGDENTQKLIAGMATMAETGEFKGEYIITFGEKDKKVTKPITKLSDKDVEFLREAAKARPATELQKEANGEIKNSVLLLRSIDKTLSTYLSIQKDIQETIKNSFRTARGEAVNVLKKVGVEEKEGVLSTTKIRKGIDVLAAPIVQDIKDKGGEALSSVTGYGSGVIDNLLKKVNITQTPLKIPTPSIPTPSIPTPSGQSSPASPPSGQSPKNYNVKTTPNPVDSSYTPNKGYSPTDTTKKTVTEQNIQTTNKVDVSGTININVSPSEFKDSLLRALDSADVQSKIASSINIQQKQENIFKGSGNVSKQPNTKFG
jgi:hypothetical protein